MIKRVSQLVNDRNIKQERRVPRTARDFYRDSHTRPPETSTQISPIVVPTTRKSSETEMVVVGATICPPFPDTNTKQPGVAENACIEHDPNMDTELNWRGPTPVAMERSVE